MRRLLLLVLVMAACAEAAGPPSTAADGSGGAGGPATSLATIPIDLRSDGLGVAAFGDPVDEVLGALTGLLGSADVDDLHQPPWPAGSDCFQTSGFGCDAYLRFVAWSPVSLGVVFSDWPHGVPAFVGWKLENTGLPAVTSEGIGIGSTASELRRAYGDALSFSRGLCEESGDWYFSLGPGRLGGLISGPPDRPDSRVVAIWAGNALGSC